MSGRRPHWDDDLIGTVLELIGQATMCWEPIPSGEFKADDATDFGLQIIAAVEDWHKAKRDSRVRTHSDECWRWHTECAEYVIKQQQAIIQRVREVHQWVVDDEDDPWQVSFATGWDAALAEVRRALDGGAE